MRGKEVEEIPILSGDGNQIIIQKKTSIKDRIKAAELLGKRYGIFKDKVDVQGSIPIIIKEDIDE